MRIRLAKEWAMHDGLSLKLALSGFQSPFVRALGKDGRDVKGFDAMPLWFIGAIFGHVPWRPPLRKISSFSTFL